MYHSPEIEIVPHFEDVLWDLDNDCEFVGAPTGTPFQPMPRVQQRRIERIYGKPVHKDCGGDLDVTKGDCGYLKLRLICKKCGKEICADL